MRAKGLLLASVLAGALGAMGLITMPSGGAARADATSALSLSGFYQMAVDTAHEHVFFSQGSSSENSILVTDFAGNQVASITGQDGVMGITLSPDGSTLYAALASEHAVSAISTATLTQTALYQLPDADTPQDVAVQSGKLWVSYGTGTAGAAAIGDFDLSVTSPAFTTQAAMGGWYSAPMLAADPSDSSAVLVGAEPGESPAAVVSYDTGVSPVTVRAGSSIPTAGSEINCDNARDVAVVPGGGQFIPACGAPDAHFRYSTTDLSQQGSYATGLYPNAIAIAAGTGTVAAGIADPNAPDIYVYAPGGDTPLNIFDTGSLAGLVSRGLGLTAGASELFAVTDDSGSYGLHVYGNPTITRSALTMGGPSTGIIGHSVTLTGSLTLNNGTYPASGTAISITRTGGSATDQLSAATGADGAFTLTDTPPRLGSYTYTASYAGDASTGPATAGSVTVTVTNNGSALSLQGPSTSSVAYGTGISLSGQLTWSSGTLPAGTAITVTRTLGSGPPVTLPGVSTAAGGSFSLTDKPAAVGTYTYTARYAGDSVTNASSATVIVTVIPDTSSLSLASPASAAAGQAIKLTGQLTLGAGPVPAGTAITVTRTAAGRPGSTAWHVGLSAGGAFTLTDTPAMWGEYSYTATYAGTPDILAAQASTTVTVAGKATSLTLAAAGPATADYEPTVHLTAHLGATYTNRTISVYAQPLGGPRTLLASGKVNSRGDLSVVYKAPHSTAFTAVFAGDARYGPVTVTRVVYVRARVSMTISGYYASKKIGGVTYRLYHRTGDLDALITVAPDKEGECAVLEAQEYYQGAWHASAVSSCGTIDIASHAYGVLTLKNADIGYPYRVRGDYIRGSDTSNLAADSGWQYFIVEK